VVVHPHPPDNPSIGGRDGANEWPTIRTKKESSQFRGFGVVKIESVRHAVGTETGTLLTIGGAVIWNRTQHTYHTFQVVIVEECENENNIATPRLLP